MSQIDGKDNVQIKQQHSEIFTLRSIGSEEQILEVVPIYNRADSSEQYKSGHWSAKEHIKYIMFLDYFTDIFSIKHNKKLWKIFTIMSVFIKTRNSSQCRSHHQKNQRKHKSIEEILLLQKAKYKNYSIQFQKIKKALRKLPIHNPIEIDHQKSTTLLIPSIKILQENVDYEVCNNPISMKNIDLSRKEIKEIKNRNSEKLIPYSKQKYIGSQFSIEMEDESQYGHNDKVKSLRVQQIEPEPIKNKNIWNYGSYGVESSFKKDQKLDKTADSYVEHDFKIIIKNPPNSEEPVANRSEPSEINEKDFQQNVRHYINIVQMKKSRSSLPSFDINELDEEEMARLGQRLKKEKKESITTEGKCKTLPPRSVSNEIKYEQMCGKNTLVKQKTINKSIFSGQSSFSGFISSFDESNKAFQSHQRNFQQHSVPSLNNFSNEKEFLSEYDKLLDIKQQEKQNISQVGYGGPNINQFFYKGQDKEEQKNLIPCVQNYGLKLEEPEEKESVMQKLEVKIRNFTKKRSEQNVLSNPANQQEDLKQENVSPERTIQVNRNNYIDQHQSDKTQHHLNSTQYHRPLIENSYQRFYFPSQNPYMYPPIYNPYNLMYQQYPLMGYNFYKFIEFYIYFIMQKIMLNNFYFQSQ